MTSPSLIGVVDDDSHVRTSLASLLRACGYRTTCFKSAEDFLRSSDRNKCACVLADINMDGISGIELLEMLVPTVSAPPVIIMTGQPEDFWRDRALQRGAAGFVQKPFLAKNLLALVTESIRTVDEATTSSNAP
jgi:FixJ family two-component response regulator